MSNDVARKTRPDGSFYSSDASERAMQLKEDGKIGGQFGKLGGRPRKPRASEILAEEARKNTEEFIEVLKRGISSDSEKTALAYLQTWIGFETEETRLRLQEERQEFDIGKASREELIAFMKETLKPGNPVSKQLGAYDIDESDIRELGDSGHGDSEASGSGS